MSGAVYGDVFAPASSSSSQSPPVCTPSISDERDELDFLGADDADIDDQRHDIFDDDPIPNPIATPVSFRRNTNPTLLSTPTRLLSAFTGGGRSPYANNQSPIREQSPSRFFGSPLRNTAAGGTRANDAPPPPKDTGGPPQDWHVEGPGRRVGYDDMTAIDWIFEYTKERQRKRVLTSGASGIVGQIHLLLDASQAWIVLVLTGLLVGAIAAAINVTTDWLGDLKLGYCSSGPEGGHFYLNKAFCCYGYDQGSKCTGWKSWSESLGVRGGGGKWFLEYIFFLVFSVCHLGLITKLQHYTNTNHNSCSLRFAQHFWCRNMRCMPNTAVSLRLRPFSAGL